MYRIVSQKERIRSPRNEPETMVLRYLYPKEELDLSHASLTTSTNQ
jgi:hypothetical protein